MHTTSDTLRFGRPLDQASGALILIHGRGSSAEDIARLTDALETQGLACFAPSAEHGTWYPQRFFAPLAANEPWLTSALSTVDALAKEIVDAGLPAERIGLIGFSQGACLALEHAYQAERRYGFVAALSGALIGPLETPRAKRDLAGMPVLLGCAEDDPHIPLTHVEQSARQLAQMNAAVTKQIYPGSAHTVFPPEIAWLNQQLAAWRSEA